MFLRQKLEERKYLKIKIDELERAIFSFSDKQDALIKALLLAYDELQNIDLILSKVNINSKLHIGDTELSLATAVIIRKNLKAKVDLITKLVSVNDGSLDNLSLLSQRDSMLGDFKAVDSAIRQADWNITIE